MKVDDAKQHIVMLSEKEQMRQQVDLFVSDHRKKQVELEQGNKRKNISLDELINSAPLLSDSAINMFFEKEQDYPVSSNIIYEVRGVLKRIQNEINSLDPKVRFFILETINFFNSKISLGKLIPALLLLTGEDQKKAICEFVFPTFLSINKNVETLAGNSEIFDPEKLHMERGVLYSFVSDTAKLLTTLFKKEFLQKFARNKTSVEFLLTAFDPATFRFNSPFKSGSEFVYGEMIDDEKERRRILLKFVLSIQTHEALYNYSLKRYAYYKQFLTGLIKENQFQGIDPINISKILAGCLVSNDQIKPDDDLIESMIDEDRFDTRETTEALKQFIDNLSPGNIYKLIGRFRVSLQQISKLNFTSEFKDIRRFSVKTILKNIWRGFIRLVEKGLTAASTLFVKIFDQLKYNYESFSEEEKNKEKITREGMIERPSLRDGPDKIIPKNLDNFSIMTQHYTLVKTDILSFRGEQEGASPRDFGYITRFFRKNQPLMEQFSACFRGWFKTFKRDVKVTEITYKNQPKIKEYFASFVVNDYLFCFGLTHLQDPKSGIIEEKSIFPYVLLFKESKQKIIKRILSREVIIGTQLKIFNEVRMDHTNAIYLYESMFMILHLLPERDWNSKETQLCIAFLIRELQKIALKRKKLLFCEKVPTLPA